MHQVVLNPGNDFAQDLLAYSLLVCVGDRWGSALMAATDSCRYRLEWRATGAA